MEPPLRPPRRSSLRRQYLSSRPTHRLSPKQERRNKLIQELVSTEETYLQHLNAVIRNFAEPLSVLDLVPIADQRVLFGELRTIRLINQVLLDQLQEGNLVGAFKKLGPYLKTYSTYARNYPNSQAVLERERSKRRFREWLAEAEAKQGLGGLKLPALLITPIQRLPRYRLLLGELTELSEGDEREGLEEVLEEVETATALVDASVAEREADAELLLVQDRLDSAAPRLLVPGRRILRTGTLQKLLASKSARPPAKWEPRVLFLFTDILLYGASKPRSDKIRVSCVLPVRSLGATVLPGQNILRLSGANEELYFRSHSHLEAEAWAEAISAAARQQREDRATLRKESSHQLPMRRATLRAARRRVSTLTSRLAASQVAPATATTLPSLRSAFPTPNNRGSVSLNGGSKSPSSSSASSGGDWKPLAWLRTKLRIGQKRRGSGAWGMFMSCSHFSCALVEVEAEESVVEKRARMEPPPAFEWGRGRSRGVATLTPVKEEEDEDVDAAPYSTISSTSTNQWWREFEAPRNPPQSESSNCVVM